MRFEVAQGARHHRARQIGRVAGPRHHRDLGAEHVAGVVKADVVLVPEAMAPAGDEEVVVAIEPQLDRALQLRRGDGRDAGEDRRLRLLAAEATAHAPALDLHLVGMQLQRVRDEVLHFARVLRRAVHVHAVAFLRDRIADLAFEVELLLAADLERAVEPARRLRDRRLRAAFVGRAHQVHRRQHILAFRVGLLRRDDRWCGLDGQHILGFRGGASCDVAGFGDDCENRLTEVADFAPRRSIVVLPEIAQDRVVVNDRAAIVRARDVGGRQHRDDARQRANPVERGGGEPAVRDRREAERAVQRAREFREVVDVGRLTGDVQVRRLVRAADAHAGAAAFGPGFGAFVDARGGVLQVVGEGFVRLQQRGGDRLVHRVPLRRRWLRWFRAA